MNTNDKKTVKAMYNKLYRITESSRDFEELTALTTKEEREHRKMGMRFTDGSCRYNAPLGLTGEYFAAKAVIDGLTANYTAADFLSIRQSCLMGAGIAHKYAARIRSEITAEEIDAFESLDYVEMIK